MARRAVGLTVNLGGLQVGSAESDAILCVVVDASFCLIPFGAIWDDN